jgi:hypothetical protein
MRYHFRNLLLKRLFKWIFLVCGQYKTILPVNCTVCNFMFYMDSLMSYTTYIISETHLLSVGEYKLENWLCCAEQPVSDIEKFVIAMQLNL